MPLSARTDMPTTVKARKGPTSERVGHAVRVKYERLWERLIESLDDWTSATEARSGQIEVALPHSGIPARRPLIVITPDEWDDMVTVMWRTALPQLKAVVTRVAASLAP